MAIVYERNLFSWRNFHNDIQDLGDLERFQLVIETLPDKDLIQTLRLLRGKGRNDYPVEAMWNSIIAGIVFDHVSVESLRRELKRNAQLREMCGFDPLRGADGIPSKSSYNRFLSRLVSHEHFVRKMFDDLVKELSILFPDFGKNFAGDGKAIHSFGKASKKKMEI